MIHTYVNQTTYEDVDITLLNRTEQYLSMSDLEDMQNPEL